MIIFHRNNMGFLAEIASFRAENIVFASEACDSNDMILELVKRLKVIHKLDFDVVEVAEEFVDRERKGSTAVMEGVALPHIRTDWVEQIFIGVGIHREGIDFNSLDGKRTNVIILSMFPISKKEVCLKFLSHLSRFLLKKESRSNLLAAKNQEEVLSFLREGI